MHVSALAGAGVNLVAACDRDRQRAAQIAALVPGARAYEDADEMLGEMRPDVVHLLTSPASHGWQSSSQTRMVLSGDPR
jgi:predicted dehydrogenase